MTRWRWGLVGALCVAMGGCQEPTLLVPAAPPGAGGPALPKEKEPEAIGEMGPQLAAADKLKAEFAALPPATPTAKGETKTIRSGVKYETLKPGDGPEAQVGNTLRVHYVGTLDNGTIFDSSRQKDRPYTFTLGVGDVIRGWDEALRNMKVGELRRLTIPPEAGYGVAGKAPDIPPNATLHFDIELLGIE